MSSIRKNLVRKSNILRAKVVIRMSQKFCNICISNASCCSESGRIIRGNSLPVRFKRFIAGVDIFCDKKTKTKQKKKQNKNIIHVIGKQKANSSAVRQRKTSPLERPRINSRN